MKNLNIEQITALTTVNNSKFVFSFENKKIVIQMPTNDKIYVSEIIKDFFEKKLHVSKNAVSHCTIKLAGTNNLGKLSYFSNTNVIDFIEA